jgi:glycosyltransferase involved in cell wall biosynthesis
MDINYGLGSLWSPPVIRGGRLRRGVFRCNNQTILKDINRDNWVVMHCDHWDVPPPTNAPVDMWLFNPVYEQEYGHLPHAAITGRDLVDPAVFKPLYCPKEYDTVTVGAWTPAKRYELLIAAMKHAKEAGRPFTSLLQCYHWQTVNGKSSSPELEQYVRRAILEHELPVTIAPTDWDQDAVNRTYNRGRVHVLTSNIEGGGPRAQVEANLAGLAHVHTEDTKGGFTRDISVDNGNGILCTPDAKGVAEAVWYCLDNPQKFRPRSWALSHACKQVGTTKLLAALHEVSLTKDWYINVDGLDCHPRIDPDWYKAVIEADKSV